MTLPLSDHLQLLAETVRVRLLTVLEAEELAVGELVQILQLPQSTVSRHLKVLTTRGWVVRRTEGAGAWLRMADDLSSPVRQIWAVVRADWLADPRAREDRERLVAVLEARRVDSRTFFGRMHTQWDALRTELFGTSFILPALLGLLPDDPVVAELGCGTGPNLVALAPVCSRVIGIDREERMLDAARERIADHPTIELRQGGLEDLPLDDDEVNAALCVLVLHHVEDLAGAFVEMERAVKPGGRIAITDMRQHDRTAYRDRMGHAHLGFSAAMLQDALPPGLRLKTWTDLRPDPDVRGPALFTAVVERR
jgi:ArsR family transcriptional regulator